MASFLAWLGRGACGSPRPAPAPPRGTRLGFPPGLRLRGWGGGGPGWVGQPPPPPNGGAGLWEALVQTDWHRRGPEKMYHLPKARKKVWPIPLRGAPPPPPQPPPHPPRGAKLPYGAPGPPNTCHAGHGPWSCTSDWGVGGAQGTGAKAGGSCGAPTALCRGMGMGILDGLIDVPRVTAVQGVVQEQQLPGGVARHVFVGGHGAPQRVLDGGGPGPCGARGGAAAGPSHRCPPGAHTRCSG